MNPRTITALAAGVTVLLALPLLLILVLAGDRDNTGCVADADLDQGLPGADGVQLAGFNTGQLQIAKLAVAVGQAHGISANGIVAALTAGLTESGLHNDANDTVPESLNYPHDGVGHDHDSLGYWQIRASVWGSAGIAALMNPRWQTDWFYGQLSRLPDRDTADPATLAQEVERSAVPDAYAHHRDAAVALYRRLGTGTDASALLDSAGDDGCDTTGVPAVAPGTSEFGARVVAAAERWLNPPIPYVWGGGSPAGPTGGGFDCSGLTLYAVAQASGGRILLPHYTQSQQDDTRGQAVPLGSMQPGDLVFFTHPGDHDSHHVAIVIGPGTDGKPLVINAPASGQNVKIEHLSDWTGERMDVRRFGTTITPEQQVKP